MNRARVQYLLDLDRDPQAESIEGMSQKEAQGKPQGLRTPFLINIQKSSGSGIDMTGRGATATENEVLPRGYHSSVGHVEK
eukprot:9568746-Heterocapsa_arctica.AAC.1